MLILIYVILGIITLSTFLVTYFAYKKKNELFKLWLGLFVFNILILIAVTVIAVFYNPSGNINNTNDNNTISNSQDEDIQKPMDELELPEPPPERIDPIESKEEPVIPKEGTLPVQNSTNQSNLSIYVYMFTIVYFALNSLLAIFVYRDASARTAITGGVAWAIIIFLSSILGLGLYLLIRPVGNVRVCKNCKKLALDTIPYCPHCYDTNEMFKHEQNKDLIVVGEGNEDVNQ